MIYREEKKRGTFFQVSKTLAENNSLSANAKGILFYLLSRNDDWQFYETEITTHFKDSIKNVKKGIRELIEQGYIERIKTQNYKGHFIYEYNIYETPEIIKDNTE